MQWVGAFVAPPLYAKHVPVLPFHRWHALPAEDPAHELPPGHVNPAVGGGSQHVHHPATPYESAVQVPLVPHAEPSGSPEHVPFQS